MCCACANSLLGDAKCLEQYLAVQNAPLSSIAQHCASHAPTIHRMEYLAWISFGTAYSTCLCRAVRVSEGYGLAGYFCFGHSPHTRALGQQRSKHGHAVVMFIRPLHPVTVRLRTCTPLRYLWHIMVVSDENQQLQYVSWPPDNRGHVLVLFMCSICLYPGLWHSVSHPASVSAQLRDRGDSAQRKSNGLRAW